MSLCFRLFLAVAIFVCLLTKTKSLSFVFWKILPSFNIGIKIRAWRLDDKRIGRWMVWAKPPATHVPVILDI